MKKAILLLTFNRLDCLKQVFKAIANARPPKLYINSDGPRDNKIGEKEQIENIRNWMLEHIDWECEIKTRFLDKNSGGCGLGVSDAITWFFENEEDGIILEDDCVPNLSFFKYCEELLDKYKDDKRIWHISGDAPIDTNIEESYYFSKIESCWGWASWADRWKYFTMNLSNYDKKHIKNASDKKSVQMYWENVLKCVLNNAVDIWDYQWTLKIIENNGLTIVASKPLISNIGNEGTHYTKSKSNDLNKELIELKEIKHPKEIEINPQLMDKIYRIRYRITEFYQLKQFFKLIFSITNTYISGKKYKVFTILGINIKVKKY